MAESEDQQIRTAIGSLLTSAFAAAVPPIDNKVFPWNALSHNLAEWPGMFRNTNQGITHGWVIKATDQDAERKNAQRDKRHPGYDLWAFYGFRGNGRIGDNSDDEFARIREIAYNAIKAEPRLGIENIVEYHSLLQWKLISTVDCGEETLHIAVGRLNVHLCC